MLFTALDVIGDAFERCNRLSPGETLNADDAALGFRRLNLVVDEMSARAGLLFKSVLTSAAQTGHITLGAGSWAAILPGEDIVSLAVDGVPITPLTMEQYNSIATQTTTGAPRYYIADGLSTVFLYPVATGQTIRMQSRKGVAAFADLNTTTYTGPPGLKSALGASLAVSIAPSVLGSVPQKLLVDERRCMAAIDNYKPPIVDSNSFGRSWFYPSILTGSP